MVHNVFVCKPGNASKAAKMCKEGMSGDPSFVNVMTDITSQFHRVIVVSQHENLAAFEKSWEAMAHPTKEMQESMKKMEGFQDMYLSGSREIYKVW